MSTEHCHVTLVSIPPESRIAKAYSSPNFADAYSIELPSGASSNPELLARFILSHRAPWISSLIAIRDATVGRFGLKTAKQLNSLAAQSETGRIGIFKIYGASPTEIVLGGDDKHLDFRLSVFCSNSVVAKRQTSTDFLNRCPLPQPPWSPLYFCHRPAPPLDRSIQSS